jgi:hypothetical protein
MTIEGPTMRIQIIANPCIEAAGDTSSFPVARRHTGIAQASDAILEAGLVDDLSNRGVEVAGSSRVELAPGEQTADSMAFMALNSLPSSRAPSMLASSPSWSAGPATTYRASCPGCSRPMAQVAESASSGSTRMAISTRRRRAGPE